MRLFVFLCAALFSLSVHAENISFDFRNAKLQEVVAGFLKGVLNRDFVISSSAQGVGGDVTFQLRDVPRDEALTAFAEVMRSYGLSIRESGTVVIVERLDSSAAGGVASGGADSFPVASRGGFPGPSPMFGGSGLPGAVPSGLAAAAVVGDPVVYFPRYRGAELLALAVRACGGSVIQASMGSGVGVVPGGVWGQAVTSTAYASPGQAAPVSGFGVPAVSQSSGNRDVLLYTVPVERADVCKKLLEDVDIQRPGVAISAALVEVSLSEDDQFSINGALSLLSGKVGLVLSAGVQAANSLTYTSKDLQAVITAVAGDSRFRLISRPSLSVLDGELARLTVGSDVPVRGAVSTDRNGNTLQSIEYKTAGLVFEVLPHIYRDDIRLKVSQQISSFQQTNTSGIDSPTQLKRQLDSVVSVREGEVLVFGGLEEERNSRTSSGVSFLPDFMRGRSSTTAKTSILLMLEVKRI